MKARGRGPEPPRSLGFTLVELTAVIIVVAILSGVAAATLGAVTGNRSAVAAKQLLFDVTFARQRAVATGTRTWVVFDADADTWSLLEENPAAPGRAGATAIADPLTGAAFVETLGAGVWTGVGVESAAFDAGTEVGFDWLGRPLNAAEADLAAAGAVVLSGGHRVEVAVATGHVRHVAP